MGDSAPAPAGGPQLVSASGQRSFPRISMPLTVRIDERTWEAADWSLGGFGLEGDGPAGKKDDLFRVTLILKFTHFDTHIDVAAKAVRVIDGVALGFRFVDLPAEKADALHYIADSYLAGELRSVEDLVESGGRPDHIAFSERSVFVMRRVQTVLRFLAVLTVAALVIGLSGFSIASTFLTVRSEHAAIASGMHMARAPEPGFVAGDRRRPGEHVAVGEELFTIVPPVTPQKVGELEERIQLLETRLGVRKEALAQAERSFAGYRQRVSLELEALQKRRVLAQAEFEAQRRIYLRHAAMARKGAVSSALRDEEEVDLRAKQRLLGELDAEEARIRQNLAHAGNGMYVSDGRSTQTTPDDIRRSIVEIKAELRGKRRSLEAMRDHFVVRSACDCVIETVAARIGEFADRGAAVYALSTANREEVEVDVLLPSDKMRFLRIGQSATVLRSDRTEEQTAVVSKLNFNPRNTGRTGLPDDLRAFGRFALVTLMMPLKDGEPPPAIGLPVLATFRIDLGVLFHYMTGLAWFLPDGPGAEGAAPSSGRART